MVKSCRGKSRTQRFECEVWSIWNLREKGQSGKGKD